MTGNAARLAQALALQQQGHLAEAAALCRQVLAREPHNSDAMHLLGLAAATVGDVPQALAAPTPPATPAPTPAPSASIDRDELILSDVPLPSTT